MHSKRSTITQSGAWSVGRKLAIVLGLLAVSGACASPLKRSDVAPQPTWVLHFDFDALRPTRVGEFLLGQFEKPEVTAQNAVFDLMPNLNVRKELHGATLYNTGLDSAAGVLLVYADLQQEKLAVKARAESQYRSSKYKNYVVHSWVVPKQTRQTRVYAAVAGQRVIIGELLASVERALDVLNGSGSLATSKAYPQLGMGSSSIQGISQQLELSEANPSAIMLRLVKGMAFEMAETGQRVSARLKLEAGSETAAGSMLSAAHGLLALAKVQWAKPEAAKLAEAITLQQDSRCVIGKLSMNSAEFVGLLSASASRRAEHNK